MDNNVRLSLRGIQTYLDQEPDVIELTTEGYMEQLEDGWKICYEESDLTGMEGVTTCFKIEPQVITLTRTGKLNSQMVFREGIAHDSLYEMQFGALMITVCATKIASKLSRAGGVVDITYGIEIENTASGQVDYHLEISPL